MANAKQDGSNLLNAEYHTGRCKTLCEQCFVNFGQQGSATCLGTVNQDKAPYWEWMETPQEVLGGKSPAQAGMGYEYPPPVRPGTSVPAGHQPLLYAITAEGKGFENMPTRAGIEPWIVRASVAARRKRQTIKGVDLGTVPFFLRVSSMSDSSWAPFEWIKAIHNAWGDQCFFNSSIRAVRQRKTALDNYHKVVVTLNPGVQSLPPFKPRDTRRVRSAKEKAKKAAMIARSKARAAVVANAAEGVFGSFRGKAGQNVLCDFLHPCTLTAAKLGQYEDVVKWYRLRALATVAGDPQTDKPVVVTQMRFKSQVHLADFCRRYDLHMEVYGKRSSISGHRKKLAQWQAAMGDKLVFAADPNATRVEFRVWTSKGDRRNASPNRGEQSVFIARSSYLRNAYPEAFDKYPYVCDRLFGGCKYCGLCATLDATNGIAVEGAPFTNPDNIVPGLGPWAAMPWRDGAGYFASLKARESRTYKAQHDYFQTILGDIGGSLEEWGISGDTDFGDWTLNPGEVEPADVDQAQAALQQVLGYEMDGVGVDAGFCQGWNTHEDAATLTAFCVWSLLCHAKRRGLDDYDALVQAYKQVEAATGGLEVLEGVSDLDDILFDDGNMWVEQFGPVR